MLYLVPVLGTMLGWFVSLRRTPYAVLWLFPLALVSLAGCAEVSAVLHNHKHTSAGVMGVLVASLVPICVFGLVTEALATQYGDIQDWREKQTSRSFFGRLGSR